MRTEQIGDATLYCGDCIDILPTLDKVDAVVTDPPYGINLAGGFSGAGGFSKPIKRREYKGENWDSCTPDKHVFEAILDSCNEAIIWGGNYFTDKLPQGSFWLAWDKENTMPTFSDGELAWSNIDKKSVKFFRYMQNGCMSKDRSERVHPTQKPVDLMRWCILQFKTTPKTILDPFMGSGTTGVAALDLGRKFIGIEKDARYFEIACKRIDDSLKQGKLFT